jgi:hypothetical protein
VSSASVAFEKFSKWKNDSTSLKITFWTNGNPSLPVIAYIADITSSWVKVSSLEEKVDLEDSVFLVESSKVTASRYGSVWLILEVVS